MAILKGPANLGAGSITNAELGAGVVSPDKLSAVSQLFGFKNRIINGDMRIAQRGSSFSSPSVNAYTLDRWYVYHTGTAPATVAQVTGPSGFRNALQITGAPGNTLTALVQCIESVNVSDLASQAVTISANLFGSSSQTVQWLLYYANATDNFSATTLITTGTWSIGTSTATYSATIASLPSGATNGLQLLIIPQNAGAFTSGTVTITGVQLEAGSIATSFDVRDYGRELIMCQRYYWRTAGGNASYPRIDGQAFTNTARFSSLIAFPVSMRATPTINLYGTWTVTNGGQPVIENPSKEGMTIVQGGLGTGNMSAYPADASCYVDAVAEL